ncbi:MAG: LL-diaminopimelate aminotransferase, partial [bacterium]
MKIEKAKRLTKLPPYLFAKLDYAKSRLRQEGKDLIDLGVGDPDLPTPSPIIKRLSQAAINPQNHRYPSYQGLLSFRISVSQWYQRRFGVRLDPEKEILTLIGSKEGIAHVSLALINPGDIALVPDPAYPVYGAGVIFAGGKPYPLPLREENHFLPRLEKIDKKIAHKAKVLFINYPNNPTGVVAPKDFFRTAVDFAKQYNVVICHDLAYSEISFDGYSPSSIMEIEGAKEVAIEFHSLSKTFNMTGWRIGFVVGNRAVIGTLNELKTNIDSGVFQAVQEAGIEALGMNGHVVEKIRKIYQRRRNVLSEGLARINWQVQLPKATFYLWLKIPSSFSSLEFAELLMERCGVVVTPGIGFGSWGEGYIRIALTVSEKRLQEAVKRIRADDLIRREFLNAKV